MIEKRHLWFPLIAVLAGLCLFCGENKGTDPEDGSMFKVELERYFSNYDDEASEVPIYRVRCSNASNDSAASGLDVAGEWIMVSVIVPSSGTYRPHMTYASPAGSIISLKLEMDDCGTSATADFLLTQGTGMG